MSAPTMLLLTAVLILANAFFVAAEFALISARRTAIEPKAADGARAARITLHAMERVPLVLAGAQLGITICSLGLGSIGEPVVAHLLEGVFDAVGLAESLRHPVSFAAALCIIVSLHVVIGEMVPKNVALAAPERTALLLTPILVLVVRALGPILVVVNGAGNRCLRLLKVTPTDELHSAFTTDQVAGLVAESHREGLLDGAEEQLLTGALEFEGRFARTVLLPLDDVVSVPVNATPRAIEHAVSRTGFSRFPVVDAAGTLSGYLHLKDVLCDGANGAALDEPVAAALIRPLPSVSGSDRLRDVLGTLQRTGAHLAVVTDSGGGVLGLVALEDVLEELVGEITDELNAATP